MKIVKVIIGTILLCICMVISIYASSSEQYVFEYIKPELTVVFNRDTQFTESKMQYIADSFAGIHICDNSIDSKNNIICSLLGHNLSTGQVNVITHRVTIWNPRCRLDVYDVTGCSRCDYTEQVLVTSRHISCHPEELPLPESTDPAE